AAGEMKRGERAQLTARGALCRDPRLGLAEAPAAEVVLTIELTAFEKGKDTWDMSEEEKLDFASARKEAAAKLFKAGRFQMAMERYKRIVDMFSYIDSFKEESQAKAAELKKLCTLNRAACQLKLRLFGEAKASCEAVLQEDSCSVKALFRRAQALFGLKDFVGCVAEVKKVLDLEPQNREARLLAQDAAKAQKEEDKKSRGLFGKMCQALGTGPIPEPYKDRRLELDGEAEEHKGVSISRPLLRQALGSKVDCAPWPPGSAPGKLPVHCMSLSHRAAGISRSEADQACHVARTWFEPVHASDGTVDLVSATDHECVDLNQWHVLLFALATGLGLASAAPWQPSKNGWTLELPDFANLCQRLATGTTRLSDYPIPEAVQEKLRSWAFAPSEAPLDMEGAPNFQLFLQRLVTSQLPYWHTAEEELQTRKRAFQLLKLMNNTPSLPNSVPGKLTPRSSCASVAPLLTLPPSQWQSATRRSFPEKRREVPVAPKFVWPLTTN
ncbi:unnamed protein product, partial [Effrenium voratum]